jgi:hypothetical protein
MIDSRERDSVACDEAAAGNVVALGAADRHPVEARSEDARVLGEREARKRRQANGRKPTNRAPHATTAILTATRGCRSLL